MPTVTNHTVINSSINKPYLNKIDTSNRLPSQMIHRLTSVINTSTQTNCLTHKSSTLLTPLPNKFEFEKDNHSKKIISTAPGPSTSQSNEHEDFSKKDILQILAEKKSLYNDYLHYKQNIKDAKIVLNELKDTLSSETMKNVHYTQVIWNQLPILNMLVEKLLKVEEREKLTKKKLQEVDKKEKIVREIIHAYSILPDILLKTDPTIIHINSIRIKQMLCHQLVQSAIEKLSKGKESEEQIRKWEIAIDSYLHKNLQQTPYQDRLKYFLVLNYKKIQQPLQKIIKKKVNLIDKTIRSAKNHIIQPEKNINTVLSVTGSKIHLSPYTSYIEQAVVALNEILIHLKVNIRQMIELSVDSHKHFHDQDRWIYPSGVRLSILSNKVNTLVEGILQPVNETIDQFYHQHINNDKIKSKPISTLTSFMMLSEEKKIWSLKLKALVEPVKVSAEKLIKVATEFKNALKQTQKHGVYALLEPTTPEEALLFELRIHTENTSEIRLTKAILEVNNITKKILQEPIIELKSCLTSQIPEQRKKEQKIFDVIHEASNSLDNTARYLQDTTESIRQENAHIAGYNPRRLTVKSDLEKIISNINHILDMLNITLESVTGVSIHVDHEWFRKLETNIRKSWDELTLLLRKGYHPYHITKNIIPVDTEKGAFYNQIHRVVLPLLNETEKMKMASRCLEIALFAPEVNDLQGRNKIIITAEKCRDINLEEIKQQWNKIQTLLYKRDIHLYQKGDELSNKTTTLTSILNKFTCNLLKTGQVLQDASWLAQWSPNGDEVKLILTKVSQQLESIKAGIKNVVEAATGTRLHNNSPEGLVAKDIGEWLTELKQIYVNSDISTKVIDDAIEEIICYLSREFATKEDITGKVFYQRIKLAMCDAKKNQIPWPVTAEEYLSKTKSRKDYTRAWAEKSLTYRLEAELLLNNSLFGLFSPIKSSVLAPLRLLNFIISPIRLEMTRRAMKKVKPGNMLQADLISKYESREYFQNGFRFISMILPQLPKTIAAIAIVVNGMNEKGEYRDKFLSRALARLPADIFWISGFAAWKQITHILPVHHNTQIPHKIVQSSNEQKIIPLANSYKENVLSQESKPTILSFKHRTKRGTQLSENTVTENYSTERVTEYLRSFYKKIDDEKLSYLLESLITKNNPSTGTLDNIAKVMYLLNSLQIISKHLSVKYESLSLDSIQHGKMVLQRLLNILNTLSYPDVYKSSVKKVIADLAPLLAENDKLPTIASIITDKIVEKSFLKKQIEQFMSDAAILKDKDSVNTEEQKNINYILNLINKFEALSEDLKVNNVTDNSYNDCQYILRQLKFTLAKLEGDTGKYFSFIQKIDTKLSKNTPPSILTPDKRGKDYSPVEDQIAHSIINSVNWHSNESEYLASYGLAFNARKTLLAYALVISNISDINQLPENWYTNENLIHLYKYAMGNLDNYIDKYGNKPIIDAARYFYEKLLHSSLGDINNKLDIKGVESIALKDYSDIHKLIVMRHYFSQDIEMDEMPETPKQKLIKIVDVISIFLQASSIMNQGIGLARSHFLKGSTNTSRFNPINNKIYKSTKKYTGRGAVNKQINKGNDTVKGKIGNANYVLDKKTRNLTITAHGMPFRTATDGISSASKVGEEIKKLSNLHGEFNKICLRSCYSARGGTFSQGQVIADKTKSQVIAYKGKYSEQGNAPFLGSGGKSKTFEPTTSGIIQKVNNAGNKTMGVPFTAINKAVSVFKKE